MEQEILWVSEAFSMQPTSFTVGHNISVDQRIYKITIEQIYDAGNPYDYYVGRNSSGEKLFALRVCASNVGYK